MASRYYRKKRAKSPGPGTHNPRFRNTESKRPSFSICGKTPRKKYRKAPGPGRYEYKTSMHGMKGVNKFGRG